LGEFKDELWLIHGGSDMPIFVKLNLKYTSAVPVERLVKKPSQSSAGLLKSPALPVDNSVVSGMRQQTRIIQRATANACADLEADIPGSARILSNIFSNIVSARHEILNLPGLNHSQAAFANLKSGAAK